MHNNIRKLAGKVCGFWRTLALAGLMLGLLGDAWGAASIPVVVSPQASGPEKLAAEELRLALQRLYPKNQFAAANQLPAAGAGIVVGSVNDALIQKWVGKEKLAKAEAYVVTTVKEGGREIGVVAGADGRGVMYGAYALLEKLGYGFYLAYDTFPGPKDAAFSFQGWELASAPLMGDRLVFDWHNFLSGCSTWSLAQWNSWTLQSQKMGYNAIMVHAYGNNPMVSFKFNGKTKPVGYLSTTIKGRDWSTMHVNDVRRLWGGEVFDGPVFGSEAGLVPEEQRAEAARKLMQQVFKYAAERGMGVFFADDVDTLSANPQELIETLPASARFMVKEGKTWVANPETPEGYQYYKAQVASLMADYPEITDLVVWFRNGGTPWLQIKADDMPAEWQKEYAAAVAQKPGSAKYWHSVNMFAIGKIVRAFDRALKETGHQKVRLCLGTWHFTFLPASDQFMPPGVKLIGLDYGVLHDAAQLDTPELRKVLSDVGAHRPVLPVTWAHHDDGNYLGRSYTPFKDFYSKLVDAKSCGYGIIHWTTRPLDLYFKSLSEQVWSATKDRPLRATCDDMAERCFGPAARGTMGEYLERWVTTAPKFSRETSDHFIDKPLTNVAETIAGCQARLKLIAQASALKLSPEQSARVNYFKGLEEFIAAFFHCHGKFQEADARWRAGDIAAARQAMQECKPEQVIQQYAAFSSLGGITRGEQGSVVSENLRWLVHYAHLRQALGLEPVRYKFSATSHDPLAQSPGAFTFHYEPDRQIWECFGETETGAPVFSLPAGAKVTRAGTVAANLQEICQAGIESDKAVRLVIQPIATKRTRKPDPLAVGDYRLRLLLVDSASTAAGQRVFNVTVDTGETVAESAYAFEPVKARYLRLACHGNSANEWNSIEEVQLASLAKDGSEPRVTASASVAGCPAEAAADGNAKSRWAALGKNHWIQFRLDPNIATDSIGISWFSGDKRKANFEILVSDDGKEWRPVKNAKPSAPGGVLATDQIDIFKEAGQANRIIERVYPIKLSRPANVQVTLTPEKGKAVLSALVLEPR